MLEVYPIQDKTEQKELCEKAGIVYGAEKLAYKGIINGELTGVLQFGIKGKCGYIYDLENIKGTNNEELLFVMGRAALNFIDLCGITDSYFEARSEDRAALISRIGFKKDASNKWYMNTEGFFSEPCKCEG